MMDQAQMLRGMMKQKKELGVQVITVTSAKGGVGKSSIALNMAIALSQRGRRVLIVDMDLGLANIDVMLGVRTANDLSGVLSGLVSLNDIIETSVHGVKFISGGSGVEELLRLQSQQSQQLLNGLLSLDDVADTIIFDTGAGINDHIIRLICASQVTWLVTTPEPTSFMDAYALIKTVSKEASRPDIQLIVNKVGSENEANAAITGFIQIVKKYTDMNISALGYILDDDHMVRAVKRQVPLLVSFPTCTAAQNLRDLADRYLQMPEKVKAGLSGFFERLLRKNISNKV